MFAAVVQRRAPWRVVFGQAGCLRTTRRPMVPSSLKRKKHHKNKFVPFSGVEVKDHGSRGAHHANGMSR